MQKNILHLLVFATLLFPTFLQAQQSRKKAEKCATMERLELKFARNPELRKAFDQERNKFRQIVKESTNKRIAEGSGNSNGYRTMYTIPIVFHIVTTNPASVTDAQIQAQLDTLNKDFAGINGDATNVPSYFRAVFGNSGIQFCLAKRTPLGDPTTGIERITTTKTSFSADADDVKHESTGGTSNWDDTQYFNVWVCALSNQILGYATFPDNGPSNEQGVVIDYRSLPGNAQTNYNRGKTLTHESGHYFNLFHIWGDDDGACTGSDDVDDTPNQADQTTGCYTGIKTDSCTSTGNGIMYQNYMDYSYDQCLIMFTQGQVTRMESALLQYRSSLLTSNACTPPVLKNYNAQLRSVIQPAQRICTSSFTPVVTIENRGSETLTSLAITTRTESGTLTTFNWTGSLSTLATATVNLNSITTTTGSHTLTIYTSNPNNNVDEDKTNDTISTRYQYYTPVTNVTEGFESTVFPPTGWDIVNPEKGITWQRVTGIAKTGRASVKIDNFNNTNIGEKDDLRLPNVTLTGVDSAFLSFQVAAATYTDAGTTNNIWDTLEVLASTDCGVTYTSLYKKYESSLATMTTATTNEFIPNSSQWRKDSINLVNYIGQNNLLLTFRNTNGYENNIYPDDIRLRTVTINPNLKRLGFLVTPNPTNGIIAVQFYPQPTNLVGIQVYNAMGQKLRELKITSGASSNYYSFDISSYAAGTYVVRAIFSDRVVTRKIFKL